jgi:hypothetical protein
MTGYKNGLCNNSSDLNLLMILKTSDGKPFDLPINLSPVADSDDINNPLAVIDVVHNPVVADSDSPQVLFTMQFTRT